jgi:lipoate-protein ligase A
MELTRRPLPYLARLADERPLARVGEGTPVVRRDDGGQAGLQRNGRLEVSVLVSRVRSYLGPPRDREGRDRRVRMSQ